MKKFLAAVLALVMVASLCACGGKNNTTATPTPEPIYEGDMEVSMWCIATEKDSNRHSYELAIADLLKKHSNLTLKWEAFENESYKTKIKTAVQGDSMPDIFFTWSCAFLGDFVKQGRVYCLDDAYKEFAGSLDEKMCRNTMYDGHKYGVPLTMNVVVLFANMDILKSVGWDKVPETYDDLLKCCDALVAAGKIPFGCSGGETWCVTEYLEPIMEKNMGGENLDKVFQAKASWGNDKIAQSVEILQSMIDKKYFDPAGETLKNDEVKANFQAGKYAFYQNGSWNCADFAKDENFKDKVQVTEFPVIDSSASKLGELIGGPSDTLAVAASAKHASTVAKYTFELGQLICKYGYLDGCGLPAWKVDYAVDDINPLTKKVSEIVANASYLVLFGDTAMSADTKDIYLEAVSKVYTKQIDGQGFINGLKSQLQ
jgi:raffinose/stachyose/melibiose transport system substrate-binding protein